MLPAVDSATPGQYVTLHNAKVDMFRGSMRLVVNQRGKMEAAESTEAFKVKVMNPFWAKASAIINAFSTMQQRLISIDATAADGAQHVLDRV